MSNDGNGQTFPKMNSSLKESLLDRMRNTHQSSERNRMARSERELPPAPRRQQARFEDLPEYKQVLTQKIASEQLGIANPFYRPHQTAAGATTMIDGRKLINFASYDYLGSTGMLTSSSGRARRSPTSGFPRRRAASLPANGRSMWSSKKRSRNSTALMPPSVS